MTLLGRVVEVAACQAALSAGDGAAVVITGPAGIGKTTLWRAVAGSWPAGVVVIEQGAYAYAALTEGCERAVDETGGAEVTLRGAPVSHSVIA